jgi:hypothetical protein
MNIVERHLLIDLVGEDVVGFSRIMSEDVALGRSYVAKSALVFTLADGRYVELLTGQSVTQVTSLAGTQELFLGYDLDPDERLSLYALTGEIHDQAPDLPLHVGRVTEVWAGQGHEAFLVAILVAESVGEAPRLNLCMESDEIEVMTYEQMQERLEEVARSYSGVAHRSYGI